MVMEILGYACVALVCMKFGAFLERRRISGRCANTSTNSQRDEICADSPCSYCAKRSECKLTSYLFCFKGRKLSPV
jgi:hypothetical protein